MNPLPLFFAFLFIGYISNAQTDSLAAYSIAQLDSIYQTKKQPKEQLPYALSMLQKGEKELNTQDTAYAKLLFYAGATYQKLRDWPNAVNYLEQAIAIWQIKMPLHAGHANCLNNLGAVYYSQKKTEQTEKYWKQALDIRKQIFGDQHPDYAASLSNLGILYRETGNYALAEPLYREALKIRKETLGDQHPDYAASLNNLGYLYFNMGNYVSAEQFYQEALKIRKETLGDKHPDYAGTLNNLGLLYGRIGSYVLAERYYQEALKIRKEVLGDQHPDYASVLNNLGILYRDIANYVLAEQLYQEALQIKKETLGDKHPGYANSLVNLAILYKKMGNYALAERYYQEALKIQKQTFGDKHPDVALGLTNLGVLYWAMGNYALAEPIYQEVSKIYKETLGDEHPEYATSLNNLGVLYRDMGKPALTEPLYLEALKIKKEAFGGKHPEIAISLTNLALLYRQMGNYAPAESFYQEALKIQKEIFGDQHPSCANTLNSLGVVYFETGNHTSAETLYQEALKIQKEVLGDQHPDVADVLKNLGTLYENMQEYDKAERYYIQCFDVKNANLATNFSWLPEKGKAAYWQKEKDFYDCLNHYAADAAAAFPQAAALAYNGNLIAKGLLLESAKEIEYAVAESKDSIAIEIYESLKDKKRLINHLVSSGTGKKEILELYETQADSLDKLLIGRLGEYADYKKKFQITWKEVQNALKDAEMAIEFARFYNQQDSQYCYMALLLRKSYELPKLVKLGSEKAIEAIPAGKGFADLYQLIWAPIDSFLNGIETVYYSPDGILNNIAFAALCSKGTEKVLNTKDIKRGSVSKTGGTEMENCTYLSERYTLHQVFITRHLAEGLKNTPIDNSILVFGGVNYDEIPMAGDTMAEMQLLRMEDYALTENIARSSNTQSRMEYLPGTQTELQNVQKIMYRKKWNVRAYSDKNASENTLKTEIEKQSPSVLHIATHGFAFPDMEQKKGDETKTYRDSDNPMARCGLLLAGANHSWTGNAKTVLAQTGEDGILTALEVSNLPLKNTKLVVLSACETGLGKIQSTEGVFGLKRGFKLALAEQIIVSLWAVPDKETMELMDIFYNDLSKTRNAVVSFEKAQRDMRRRYPTRPDLWAGFVLVR